MSLQRLLGSFRDEAAAARAYDTAALRMWGVHAHLNFPQQVASMPGEAAAGTADELPSIGMGQVRLSCIQLQSLTIHSTVTGQQSIPSMHIHLSPFELSPSHVFAPGH